MNQTFQSLFKIAMKRDVPGIEMPMSRAAQAKDVIDLNLGAGEQKLHRIIPLDYPDWDADISPIPYGDGTVRQIHAYHFLEHCTEPVRILQECQRVLISGGLMNICVPFYTSSMNAHDLDHKHNFCEETWKILFNNPYYNKNKIEWKFDIGFNMICGIQERNLCLLTQLIKR